MIKLISIADFSSHYFKEVSSLSKIFEQVLNNDSKLDINAPKEDRPSLDNVLKEIQRTRTRVNNHQNSQKDSFKKKSPDDFSLLGLTTNRNSQLLYVKGKPISFKSRAKGTLDITIRNPQEFSNFLHQGGFQRQHMSSMLSQVFDPSFIFNAVYHNISRWINRRIVKSQKPCP